MAELSRAAFFLPVEPGHRFCILHGPAEGQRVRGAVLHVPPFAEELNKCRRTTAVMARALASDGWAVLQIDLLGCGDSSGEAGEATWEQWIRDVHTAYRWLAARYKVSVWLWGLRSGCLLATHASGELGVRPNLLFWQPILSGSQHLTQFLRLKVAGEMFDGSRERSGTRLLKEKLLAGEATRIAGYELPPALARSLDSAELVLPPDYRGRLLWLEVAQTEPAALSPVSAALTTRLKEQGVPIRTAVARGNPFWQTVEIAECPELIEQTLRLMRLERE